MADRVSQRPEKKPEPAPPATSRRATNPPGRPRTHRRTSSVDDIQRHLDRSDDPILVILRGHLLIETRLRDILVNVTRAPEELPDARLSFYQVLAVDRAIIGRQDDPAWAFIKRLNEVRNRIAHHLEPGDLDEIIGSLVERLWAERAAGLETPLNRLRGALHYACGYLDSLKGAVGLRQAYVPRPGTR